MLAGSQGTLGYVTRLRLKLRPAGGYVVSNHTVFNDVSTFTSALMHRMYHTEDIEFLDAAVFSDHELIMIEGRFVDHVPSGVQIYSLERTGVAYYTMLRKGGLLAMTLLDSIYRWDPDGYFSSMHAGEVAHNPYLRQFYAWRLPKCQRSDALREIFMTPSQREGLRKSQSMYVDYLIPLADLPKVMTWFDDRIGCYPLYMAPVGNSKDNFKLWKAPANISIDFGIGYGPHRRKHGLSVFQARLEMDTYFASIHASRLAGTNVAGGSKKMWDMLPRGAEQAYYSTKRKYDPANKLMDLVAKTLL
jgi:FAD/FMN-containing dehydrogenase